MSRSPISELVVQLEQGKLSRRGLLRRAAALGIGASVANLAMSTGSVTLDARRAEAAQSNSEGYVTIGNESSNALVANFNPTGPAGGSIRGGAGLCVYMPLGVWNAAKKVLNPALADSYGFNEDNTVLTVNIGKDQKWSDGEPLTARDVVFTWDMYKKFAGLGGNGCRTVMPYLSGWDAPDDYTVNFTFSEVFTPGLYSVLGEVVVPEHAWKDVADPVKHIVDKPVGSGPFTELTKMQSQIYELSLNPHYRYKDRVKIKGVRVPALADNAALGLALTNGELDWAGIFIPDIENAFVAKDKDHFRYWFPPLGSTVMFWPNTEVKPFDDPNVRKALSMLMDRKNYAEIAMWGYSEIADATGMSPVFENEKSKDALAMTWTQQNVDEAKKLLDAAGITEQDGKRQLDGKPWEIVLTVVGSFSDYVQVCQLIQGDFEKAGIAVKIDPLEWGAWADKCETGNFQSTVLWSAQGQTPFTFYRATMSKTTAKSSTGRNTENYARWSNDEADTLLTEYAQSSDPAKLAEISAKLQMLFAENAPAVPLFYGPVWCEYNTSRVEGFPSDADPYTQPQPGGGTGMQTLLHLYPVGQEKSDWSDVMAEMPVVASTASPAASPAATPKA